MRRQEVSQNSFLFLCNGCRQKGIHVALTLIIKQIPGGPAGSPNHHPSFEQTAVTLWHQAEKLTNTHRGEEKQRE